MSSWNIIFDENESGLFVEADCYNEALEKAKKVLIGVNISRGVRHVILNNLDLNPIAVVNIDKLKVWKRPKKTALDKYEEWLEKHKIKNEVGDLSLIYVALNNDSDVSKLGFSEIKNKGVVFGDWYEGNILCVRIDPLSLKMDIGCGEGESVIVKFKDEK